MRFRITPIAATIISILLLAVTVQAGPKREIARTFELKKTIKIETVSGSCEIVKGDADVIVVNVKNSYNPEDSFEPSFRESSRTLRITERIVGSNYGNSTWEIIVPDGVFIEFSSASGEFEATGYTGDFEISTASGDINLENCTGQFEISTASGDIKTDNCTGEFQLSTASGRVYAGDIILDEASTFSTASGRVDVRLAKTSDHDLTVSSASGSAILNYNGHPLKGTFELSAKVHNGRIDSPVDFDDEQTYSRWGGTYVKKTFTRGDNDPLISIETASGRAVLKDS